MQNGFSDTMSYMNQGMGQPYQGYMNNGMQQPYAPYTMNPGMQQPYSAFYTNAAMPGMQPFYPYPGAGQTGMPYYPYPGMQSAYGPYGPYPGMSSYSASYSDPTMYQRAYNSPYGDGMTDDDELPEGKNSLLGLIALICSILGIFTLPAFIMSIIDLSKHDGRKKTLSTIAFIICGLYFTLGFFVLGFVSHKAHDLARSLGYEDISDLSFDDYNYDDEDYDDEYYDDEDYDDEDYDDEDYDDEDYDEEDDSSYDEDTYDYFS